MAIEHPQTMTVEEYFLLEENDPDTRYEYVDGQVYAMAGELRTPFFAEFAKVET
jgi:Uma2 family endonuclease